MRVRAVIEFDVHFDEDRFSSIEDLISYHQRNHFVVHPTPEKSLAYELKELVEDEHRGLAEYESAVVTSLEFVE
jgi:hypothetical protein